MLKVDTGKAEIWRERHASLLQPQPFLSLGCRLIHFKYLQCFCPGGLSVGEGVETSSQDRILRDSPTDCFRKAVFGKTRTQDNVSTQCACFQRLVVIPAVLYLAASILSEQCRCGGIIQNQRLSVQQLMHSPHE